MTLSSMLLSASVGLIDMIFDSKDGTTTLFLEICVSAHRWVHR